jgi:hypothetical protein
MVSMHYCEVQEDTCIVERSHSLWNAHGPASMVDFAETNEVKTWTLSIWPEHDALAAAMQTVCWSCVSWCCDRVSIVCKMEHMGCSSKNARCVHEGLCRSDFLEEL